MRWVSRETAARGETEAQISWDFFLDLGFAARGALVRVVVIAFATAAGLAAAAATGIIALTVALAIAFA